MRRALGVLVLGSAAVLGVQLAVLGARLYGDWQLERRRMQPATCEAGISHLRPERT